MKYATARSSAARPRTVDARTASVPGMSLPNPLHRPYPADAYRASSGEASAWLRRDDAEPEITYRSGGTCEYLATGDSTGGHYGLYRWTFGDAESGPDPHFHRSITESFYVLEGSVRLYDGAGWVTAPPATSSTCPRAACTASAAAAAPGCC